MAKLAFNYFTVKGYADAVHKHPRTIRRWIAEGKISAKKDRGGRDYLIIVKSPEDFEKSDVTQ